MKEYEVLKIDIIMFEENDIITESPQSANGVAMPWVDDE